MISSNHKLCTELEETYDVAAAQNAHYPAFFYHRKLAQIPGPQTRKHSIAFVL